MRASPLDQKLDGVLGGRTAKALQRAFEVETVGDLLSHYPRRYAKRGELTPIDELPSGEAATIVAEVVEVQERAMRQRRGSILEVLISDGRGRLSLTFFNQAWRKEQLPIGGRGIFAGKVGEYRGVRQLAHPDYQLFEGALDESTAQQWAERPIPIYPATSTVSSWQVQNAIGVVLDTLGEVPDPVPAEVAVGRKLVPFRRALELVHRPQSDTDWAVARHTLRFQEALVLQAALLQQRADRSAQSTTARVPREGGLLHEFDAALPFSLTDDQRTVGGEIGDDLARPHPMNRLVQGEVGSGKTLVALRAMLTVADSGGQSALLAPTEVLAAQHLRSIVRTLGPDLAARLRPTLLTGQLGAKERRRALLDIVSGASRLIVGTHALLGESVEFADLGLVVVDEQHRFGVEQRETLRAKGSSPPHLLVLTATPIPRTVAMTVFGDLDVSTIRQLPGGRQGITSHVVPLAEHPAWFGRVWQVAAEQIELGRQVFVVCPAIDENADAGPLSSVESVAEKLRAEPHLQGRRIEVVHGRMPGEEKDSRMRAFAAGDLDVLVATTVIEVGVDVPNASVMAVLEADRFGVSQLHQLRGRVGRGGVPGLCFFVTFAEEGSLARERVDAVAATLDGFELAQADLELRQEGDVLGTNQSGGRSSLRLLRVARDGEIIARAREAAAALLTEDAALTAHPDLAAAIARRLDETSREFLAKG